MATQFDYLLNAMELAGHEPKPFEAGYGDKRAALLDHVRALEKDAERYRWLRARTHKAWELFEPPTVWFVPTVSHEQQTLDAAVDLAMQRAALGAA